MEAGAVGEVSDGIAVVHIRLPHESVNSSIAAVKDEFGGFW